MSSILREIALHCKEGKYLSEVLSWANEFDAYDCLDL